MIFNNPIFFIFLLFIPLLFLYNFLKKKKSGFKVSAKVIFKNDNKSFLSLTYFIPTIILLIAYALFVFALARPQNVLSKVQKNREGIAIELLFDKSSSMQTINFDGLSQSSRLDSAKEVLHSFIFGTEDGEFSGRNQDLVGLVTFARYADTVYPLTLSHETLKSVIDDLTIADQELNEDGTNIGDAIALASARLKMLDEKKDFKVKSKIIILLTDGENNVGEKSPQEAANIAASWGIKIYSIAFNGSGYINYGLMKMPVPSNPNSFEDMRKISDITNGKAFEAKNKSSLEAVYKEIDNLEKSKIESSEINEKEELFLKFLLPGLFFLVIGVFLKMTIYRSVM